jgi:hypothetical protein
LADISARPLDVCSHRLLRNSDYGISPRLAPPAKLCSLSKKKIAVASGRFRILVACDDDRRYDGG